MGEPAASDSGGNGVLQFGHDGDVMEWGRHSMKPRIFAKLQFGHDGDVMEWQSPKDTLSRSAGSFNSATTVMSWNGLLRDASRLLVNSLQFGHDGDVMEWIRPS